MTGRSINLFLVDGSASGMRLAEIGLSTIKSVVCPRASLAALGKRPESKRTGVYFLVGPDPDTPGRQRVYIGEGDVILTRITAHDKDDAKEFWTEAILFISKDENLTKAHGRYLEARFITLAKAANRYSVDNGTQPSEEGKLPEAAIAEMEEFVFQAKLLLATLGYSIFEPQQIVVVTPGTPPQDTEAPTFTYSGGGFEASLDVDVENGLFVVRAGSKARKDETPALQPTYRNLRQQLISDGVLETRDDHLLFSRNHGFTAITAAAQVVSGQTVSGRAVWKTVDNIVFKDWQDSQIAKDAEFETDE